jgi:hypothetical protein
MRGSTDMTDPVTKVDQALALMAEHRRLMEEAKNVYDIWQDLYITLTTEERAEYRERLPEYD